MVILGGKLTLTLHRTLRVPDMEGRVSALPPSLGQFPVYRVADYASKCPSDWNPAGHFFAIWPQEALWIGFSLDLDSQPLAVVVGAGKVNALTGALLTEKLTSDPQNYMVAPTQPWIDGFKPTTGSRVRQFVAAELGSGQTAEEQILHTAEFGGIQIGIYEPKFELVSRRSPDIELLSSEFGGGAPATFGGGYAIRTRGATRGGGALERATKSMGLGAGGSIRQQIYPDPHLQGRLPSEVWHKVPADKAYVYMVHAGQLPAITGQEAPPSPATRDVYRRYGIPWFDLKDAGMGDVEGGKPIDGLKPVSGTADPGGYGPTKPYSNQPNKVNQGTSGLW